MGLMPFSRIWVVLKCAQIFWEMMAILGGSGDVLHCVYCPRLRALDPYATSRVIAAEAVMAPAKGPRVGVLFGKLASNSPVIQSPVSIQPGTTAPMSPAMHPAMALKGVILFQKPKRTGMTAVAHSKSATKKMRKTDIPSSATKKTGIISRRVSHLAWRMEVPPVCC